MSEPTTTPPPETPESATDPVDPTLVTRPAAPRLAVTVGIPVALAIVVSVVLLVLALPGVKASPHGLPIGLAGPADVTSEVTGVITQRDPDAFSITSFADRAALEAAIRNRDVYGGIVLTPEQPPLVITASAASPVAGQELGALGRSLAQEQGTLPEIVDLVPYTDDDPRGVGFAAGILPLAIAAILPAVVLAMLTQRRQLQLLGLAAYTVAAALFLTFVSHTVLGSLAGNVFWEAAVYGATVAAGALMILGLRAVIGRAGIAVGAVLLVLVGNPLSGASNAPEFLASPWREIGQAMPPGAGSQLLRTYGFFDGKGSMNPWIVLGVWAAIGLVLLAVGRTEKRSGPAPLAD